MAEAVDEVAVFILRVGLVVQRSMHEAIEIFCRRSHGLKLKAS